VVDYEKLYIYSIYLYLINMKNILGDRIAFYLDANGKCHWEYVGMIDSSEGTEFFKKKPSDLVVKLDTCRVCGKHPIRYNFILKNTLTNPELGWKYVSVGSECIQFLDKEDMLRIKRDQKILREKHDKENAKVFGSYIRNHFMPSHPEVWNMEWEYFGHKKNVGGSLMFLSEKCRAGVPMHEKIYGQLLKEVLEKNGIELPNIRKMKEIITIPSYEDFKADDQAIARAENGYERFYESRSGIMNDSGFGLSLSDLEPKNENKEIKMVPEGYELIDYYGISPFTGKREILYMTLRNIKTLEEEFPTVVSEWDPIIEVVDKGNIIHMHLQKFIKSKKQDPILKALQILAGNDPDFAGVRNNIGFNGRDTEFGHSLASQSHLSPKQKEYGKKLLRKYHRQIPKDLWDEIFGDEKNE
jgi:hypothetical protein